MSWYLLEGTEAELEVTRLQAVGYEVHDLKGKTFKEMLDVFRPLRGSPREFFWGSPHAEELLNPHKFSLGEFNLLEAVLIEHAAVIVLCGTVFLPCGRLGWIAPSEFRKIIALPHHTKWWTDGGLGSRRPVKLVLGDQLNPRHWSYPFPFGTPAGLEMVWPAVDPRHVRVMNVRDPWDPYLNVTDLGDYAAERAWTAWHGYRRPQVLALGTEAAAACRKAGVPYEWLLHPNAARRFHYHSRDTWISQFHQEVVVREISV